MTSLYSPGVSCSDAFADSGVDAIEIGFPYSDPVMDGPTIQEAANTSLNAGTGAKEVFEALAHAIGVRGDLLGMFAC